ncbi:uncharacterized protein LOC121731969 [Aricia agestis]|uniref:uncharacterized protein LOC121731969 n=1 Tax=Aricia agestis TaxID=91739 RepID=UPI001C204A7A|nr:uncharacterized protein LOC121731969 [Aricia agestis]
MSAKKAKFLLDIRVEISDAFTDEYDVSVKTEDLFEAYLLNIRQNSNKIFTKDKKTRNVQKQTKKKFYSGPSGHKQYGKSIILTKSASEIISNMKNCYLELYLKSITRSNGSVGTISIPWTKSFIYYLKNITMHPKLPPVLHKEKFKVANAKENISLGSLNVTIKLLSVESNFYKFVSSSQYNINMYRHLFSSPKVLENVNSNKIEDYKNATENKNIKAVPISCNNISDTTYNIIESTENNIPRPAIETQIESTKDMKNITVENSTSKPNNNNILYKLNTTDERAWNECNKHINSSFRDRTYRINYVMFNKDKTIFQSEKESTDTTPNSFGVEVASCHDISCHTKMRQNEAPIYDNSLALDVSNLHKKCCRDNENKSSPNLNFDEHPCYCTCECKYEFIRETTYCKICRGYEIIGEEFDDARGQDMPMPCPIFHKLVEKNKLKSRSSSGSLRRRKFGVDGSSRSVKSSKSSKSSTPKTSEKRLKVPEKKVAKRNPQKEAKKKKVVKLKQIDYSYKTPHAGHGGCGIPCMRSAILKCNVPKGMGWFWTADNIKGLKYRPTWRPGAAEKHLVHLLQMARHHKQIISKKKKKELVKSKRPLKRPLLVVHKKDGEFTVTMETMKASTKPREVYEHPYEDKPVLTYTIGRTDEENKERLNQKQRKQRRLEREQRTYLQSAFKNMCQEICLKTCQQALGILPEAEDKQGLCYANATWVEPEDPNPSCSCSDNSLSVSDTDSDEWILEFTPPNAFFDPSRKGKKVVSSDKDTEYILQQS